jgi:hypothetical protein
VAAVVLAVSAATSIRGEPEQTATIPLKRVVLFTSGVGFFEHDGEVSGDARVDLTFNSRAMNDLLMSLVVEDLGGGKVSTVGYPSKTPIAETLKTFSIDLSGRPTLAQLLDQVRGEQVELEAPSKIIGTIVGVGKRKKIVAPNEVVESDVLDLLTDSGLRAIPLDTASRVKLLNARLDADLRKALAVLATAHGADQRTVTLHFLGKGQRPVRIGYVQEMPTWQCSYRLVLDETKPAWLQSWATVDNITDTDWNNVSLSLVSGRPISFRMDLYEPLFVPRPEVKLDLYSALRPQRYGEALQKSELERRARELDKNAALAERADALKAGVAAAPAAPGAGGVAWDLRRGVEAVSSASAVGELVQYTVATPVTLTRQRSALLPIINTAIKGEKVAIYDETVLAKHPLNGLKLVNPTDLYLMPGPITVLDGGTFAGDAIIDGIAPHGERLISYGVDLDVEVAPEAKPSPEQIVKVQLVKGVMTVTQKLTRAKVYNIKNTGTKPQKLLILYPSDPAWTLVEPQQATEKTRNQYRFAVASKAGEPTTFVVREERTVGQQITLSNVNEDQIRFYLSSTTVSDKTKAALADIFKRKQAIGELAGKRQQLEGQVQSIDKDQARIRQNMAQLDRTSDLYKRYVTMLSDQEERLAAYSKEIQSLVQQENTLRNSLNEYLMGLNLQ